MEYDFVWTTQLLKDIKQLSLGGEDSAVAYSNCFCHDQMTKLILGMECPMNQYLAWLWHILNRLDFFVGWSDAKWKTFIWALHIVYLMDLAVAPMAPLSARIEACERLDTKILPAELNRPFDAAPQFAIQELETWKRLGDPGIKQYCHSTGPQPALPPDSLAAHLAPTMIAAKKHISEELKIRLLFPEDTTAAEVMGQEFLSMVTPAGQKLCWCHHLYSTCSSWQCQWEHNLKSKISKPLMESITKCIKERLNVLAQQHPK
jgi:hypothetical protein